MLKVTKRRARMEGIRDTEAYDINVAGKRVGSAHISSTGDYGWYASSELFSMPRGMKWGYKTLEEAANAGVLYARKHVRAWEKRHGQRSG